MHGDHNGVITMSWATRGGRSSRTVAVDAALVLSSTDGHVNLSSTTGTKTATFAFDSDSDTLGGEYITLYCSARSGGQYNIACTYGAVAGTLTIDAQHEAPVLQRQGTTLNLISLGGSTFA
jgi:hypothetical protein